jgi:ribonuclease Y
MALIITLAALLVAGVVGLVIGYFLKQYQDTQALQSARSEVERLITEAEAKAKEIALTAKDEALRIRDEAEGEAKKRRAEMQRQEQRVQERRESLDRRFDQLENRSRKLDSREKKLEQVEREIETVRQQQLVELERVSGLGREEARELLLASVEQETRQDMARVIREVEQEAHEEAERRAREIIVTAIQRCASDQVAESVVSTVPLPSEEMKGRIIGRQGRNIRTIEQLTGVDVIVDDTPEAVILSCFDPVRREVARLSLHKLIQDGRIHPARIEKIVKKTQDEVEQSLKEEGEKAAFDAGVPGLHPEILKLLGRLKYRTSYGQNVLAHSVETAHIGTMIAAELGADVDVVRAGCLLHDIGKAVSHEVDGAHALIGADIARRYGVNPKVIHCIVSHHHEEDQQSIEAILVEAADAISGSRPGARRETLEIYMKRIKALENVASSFTGVAQSYAIQAGREIRIIVKPEDIDDLAAIQLSRDIAKKVEASLEYPGQIKVTVIRETRAVDYAK